MERGATMTSNNGSARARPGDRLVIRGRHLGQPDTYAEIIEAEGHDGGPPYRVLLADGRIIIYSPGSRSAAWVEHVERASAA
jgi:Domain of unknown function (DUF1918)